MKKVLIGIIGCLFFPFFVYATNFGDMAPSLPVNGAKNCTAAVSPGSIVQAAPGNIEWTSVNNGASEDNKEASLDSHGKNPIKDAAVRLILADGSIGGTDKSNGDNWTESSGYVSYGGDTWKANLTPQMINDPDFGFAMQMGGGIANSLFLKATNFGFRIPSGASVSGVTVEVKRREALSDNTMKGYVDHIRMAVCYTSGGGITGIIPLILATIGDVQKIRVAPGEVLFVPMTLRSINAGDSSGASIQYQVSKNNTVVINETDFVKTLTATSPATTIQIPKNLTPGIYEAVGTLLLGNQTAPDLVRFRFTVENKIAGIFVSQLLYWAGILLVLCVTGVVIIWFSGSRHKIALVYDYANIPEPNRVYFEMISDMVTQMHESIGDKAYTMADAVAGLSVDKTTGRIMKITKDPSEVVSVLFIKYQNVFKKKLKIEARVRNKKTENDTDTIAKNLEKFEKYFSKK